VSFCPLSISSARARSELGAPELRAVGALNRSAVPPASRARSVFRESRNGVLDAQTVRRTRQLRKQGVGRSYTYWWRRRRR
jgi:hypothetical protein